MLSVYQNSNADNYESIKAGFIVRKLEYETIISSLEKRKFGDEKAFARYLYGEIRIFCEAKKKKAVLLLDNFDRIVGSVTDDGNLLRETLINYNDLQSS